eukprot:CAMPEP_0172492192 /NCGR_PEP_ID=MMETSP1066-20121228/23244_1 /TAXON_ID=671091 /ORGANISM="Coscinodiscus wailesii, Strain CCMP2513" /LENGTH=374 /DNA_ID=CAMNT_0013261665 /DNA_START=68 /DNA_END=1192 /DNA_ORIENTATION=+
MIHQEHSEILMQVTRNDVLCGRGGASNNHIGNIRYRALVKQHQLMYLHSKSKKQKSTISQSIVDIIKNSDPSGRFLNKNEDGKWYEVDEKKALLKTSQALREDAPLIRQNAPHQPKMPQQPPFDANQYNFMFNMSNSDFSAVQKIGTNHINFPSFLTTGKYHSILNSFPMEATQVAFGTIPSTVTPQKTPPPSLPSPPHTKIKDINENDVLFGRGDGSNRHPGNLRYRLLIKQHQKVYRDADKNMDKRRISLAVVNAILSRQGRFMKKDKSDGTWYPVDLTMAVAKTSQALREVGPRIRDRVTTTSQSREAILKKKILQSTTSNETRTINKDLSAAIAVSNEYKRSGSSSSHGKGNGGRIVVNSTSLVPDLVSI